MTTSFTFPTGSHPNGPVIDLHGMTGSVFLVSAFVSTPAAELASFRTRGQWKKRSECLLNILFQKSGRPEVEEPYIYIFFSRLSYRYPWFTGPIYGHWLPLLVEDLPLSYVPRKLKRSINDDLRVQTPSAGPTGGTPLQTSRASRASQFRNRGELGYSFDVRGPGRADAGRPNGSLETGGHGGRCSCHGTFRGAARVSRSRHIHFRHT